MGLANIEGRERMPLKEFPGMVICPLGKALKLQQKRSREIKIASKADMHPHDNRMRTNTLLKAKKNGCLK